MENIFVFLAGIALFLMSFQLVVKYMQRLIGRKISTTVKKAGNSKIKALGLGAGATTLFQNSTAVIVLVISFVEMGFLTLLQSMPLVLGINIGASLTLISILLSSFSISVYFSILALIGAFIVMLGRTEKIKNIGYLLFGIGILFLGMFIMSDSMSFLKTLPLVQSILTTISHPLVLIAIGLLLGTLIQSSLASNAILITLCAVGGSAGLSVVSALWLSFSFKLGPTFMGMIASFGGKKSSQAVALFHFLVNLLILIVFSLSTLTGWHIALANAIVNPALVIVLCNIIVCTFTVLLLLPFSKLIGNALGKCFKDKQDKYADFIMQESSFSYTSVALELLRHQVKLLQDKIVDNVSILFSNYFIESKIGTIKTLEKNNEEFLYMCNLFTSNLAKLKTELNAQENSLVRYFYNLTSRYSSMSHRYEKLVILLKETKNGMIFKQEEQDRAKELFERINELANMSDCMLKCYLSSNEKKCYYLNNIIKVDDEVANMKLTIKKEMFVNYRKSKDNVQNTEQYARLINETEQLGEHFTAIGLNML